MWPGALREERIRREKTADIRTTQQQTLEGTVEEKSAIQTRVKELIAAGQLPPTATPLDVPVDERRTIQTRIQHRAIVNSLPAETKAAVMRVQATSPDKGLPLDEYLAKEPVALLLAEQNIEQRKEQSEYKQTVARLTANAEGPIPNAQLVMYRNPNTRKALPEFVYDENNRQGRPVTGRDAQELHYVPMDAYARQALTARLDMKDVLAEMKELAFGTGGKPGTDGLVHTGIFVEAQGLAGRFQQTLEAYLEGLSQSTQGGRDYRALLAMQEGFLTMYARGLTTEKGNIATIDTERIRLLFPTIAFGTGGLQDVATLAAQQYGVIERIAMGPLEQVIASGKVSVPTLPSGMPGPTLTPTQGVPYPTQGMPVPGMLGPPVPQKPATPGLTPRGQQYLEGQ